MLPIVSCRVKKSGQSLVSSLHYSGIEFPVKLSQINKIEKQNQINVNVFGYESAVFPLQLSKEKYEKTMNLLYISVGKKSLYIFGSKILIDSCSTKRNTKKKSDIVYSVFHQKIFFTSITGGTS